jgi:hypothetical protein
MQRFCIFALYRSLPFIIAHNRCRNNKVLDVAFPTNKISFRSDKGLRRKLEKRGARQMAPAFNQTLILSKNFEKIITNEPLTATKFSQRHFICNIHIVYLRNKRVSVEQLQIPVMIGAFSC